MKIARSLYFTLSMIHPNLPPFLSAPVRISVELPHDGTHTLMTPNGGPTGWVLTSVDRP